MESGEFSPHQVDIHPINGGFTFKRLQADGYGTSRVLLNQTTHRIPHGSSFDLTSTHASIVSNVVSDSNKRRKTVYPQRASYSLQ